MPRLNTADALYLGAAAVENAYLGDTLVWGSLSVPINAGNPTLSASEVFLGAAVTTTTGTWSHSPTSYAYQWQAWDGDSWEAVSGETTSSFTPTEVGLYRARVIATNAQGDSAPAYSVEVEAVEAPEGLTWAGGWRVTFSSGDSRATSTSATPGNYAHAYTEPVSGSLYVEFETVMSLGPADVGLWMRDSVASDPGSWGDFAYVGGSSVKVNLAEYWSLNTYGDATYITGPEPNHTDDPVYRVGIAFNTATGAVWVRDVWSTGAAAWIGGGNPAAGTTPTFTMTPAAGFTDVRLAASFDNLDESTRIIPAAEHHGTAPAGFTAL